MRKFKHGGKRKGAGRPAAAMQYQSIHIRLPVHALRKIKRIGPSINEFIRNAVHRELEGE